MIDALDKKLYYNYLIRFVLESYTEITMTSLINVAQVRQPRCSHLVGLQHLRRDLQFNLRIDNRQFLHRDPDMSGNLYLSEQGSVGKQ